MRQKYKELMLHSMEEMVEVNKKEKELQKEFNERRREEVRPLHDELDRLREEMISQVAMAMSSDIRKMATKLGISKDKEEVQEAFRIGIASKILEMMENYISVGAIDMDEEMKKRLAEVKKEMM